jgi:ABC-type transporter Mla subunit MlaD
LSKQVTGVAQQLHAEAKAMNEAHSGRLAEMTTHAKGSIDALAEGVRTQTAAIEQVTGAVRAAVSDLGSAVGRNVALMNEGAGKMREAAEQFTVSGRATSEVLDRSREVAAQLSQTAIMLSSASQDVKDAVADYRSARETFAGMVDVLRGTVDVAKRDVALTSDLVGRLEAAAQKLVAAQGQADEYLAKVSEVIAATHRTFSEGMGETLGRANNSFHQALTNATSQLSTAFSELEEMLADLSDRPRH